MTEKRRVVVPFERPAAYWATRARRHYSPDRLPDAARLMRKALEKSGDPGMALELARIYEGMGCCTAAERCLLRAVARSGLTGDACFLIGRCALNRGDEDLGERAMEMSLRLDPAGLYAEQAQDTLEYYPWTWEDTPRRGARGEVWLYRARDALARGDADLAREWAKRAWDKSQSPRIALMLGALTEDDQQALACLEYAARLLPGELRPRLLLAAAYARAGRQEDARRQLVLAQALCASLGQTEDYCAMAWEMHCPQEALTLISRQLEAYPASVDYLRLKYLTLMRMGDVSGAGRTLALLTDIDPDDGAGLWYRRHPEDLRLYAGRAVLLAVLGGQIRAVPDRLNRGMLNRVLHLMVIALGDWVDEETVYRLLPPLWRRLSPGERRACDEDPNGHYPLALALYLLLAAGQQEKAKAMYSQAPGKRRLLRTLKRFARWMGEE